MDRRFLKPGWLVGHLLVVAAFLVCCRLGIWQWHRTKDADGTLQNLAYAILWPCFGIAFIYMWLRFLMLEKAKDAADDQAMDEGLAAILADGAEDPAESGDRDGSGDRDASGDRDENDESAIERVVSVDGTGGDGPAGVDERDEPEDADPDVFVGTVEEIDDDEDPELAAYNRALAALAERDERRGS